MRFLSKLIGTGLLSATSTAASVVRATACATLRPFQRLFDFPARQPQITYPPSVLESVIQALPSTRRNTLDGDLPQRRVTRASIARASGASSTISRPSVVGDREASGLEAPLRLPRPSVGTAAKSIGRSEDFLEKPKKPDLGVRRISRTFIVARERRTSALTRRISLVAKPKSARLSDSFSVNGQTAAHLTDLTSNRENDDDLFKQLAKYSLDQPESRPRRRPRPPLSPIHTQSNAPFRARLVSPHTLAWQDITSADEHPPSPLSARASSDGSTPGMPRTPRVEDLQECTDGALHRKDSLINRSVRALGHLEIARDSFWNIVGLTSAAQAE